MVVILVSMMIVVVLNVTLWVVWEPRTFVSLLLMIESKVSSVSLASIVR